MFESISVVKMCTQPNVFYKFNRLSIKIAMTFFMTEEKLFQKFIQVQKTTPNSKKHKSEGITIPVFKKHSKAILTKTT